MTNLNRPISVPSQNSADNVNIEDVVGNKLDDEAGDSIYSKSYIINAHFHSASNVYPTLADGVTVTATANAWTDLGTIVEVVPINTITSPFDIHFIGVEGVSANDVYELVLYSGASESEVEIGRVRITKTANQDGTENTPFQTIIVPANTRISAAISSAAALANTATISVFYHTY